MGIYSCGLCAFRDMIQWLKKGRDSMGHKDDVRMDKRFQAKVLRINIQ